MIFFIKQKYSSSSYNGGINFTKDMIKSLPLCKNNEYKDIIVKLVKDILDLDINMDNDKFNILQKLINRKVYELYNLSDEQILLVENN